ncbi:Hypothetical protein SMAX5B_010496 [Scophthalmus maximus]|uniref:Uncharacterized protein n=1 Tax=Scophthalmus maximus TaxID=52904 RepID=A0A2U9BU01_SCOMX|nr:Hypothetical protein SMAX5B_010496 [Scophthalmus maximus]
MSNQDTADTESGVRLASRCHVRSCPGGRTMRTLQSSPARYGIPEHDLCTLGRSHKLRQPRYNLILNCAELLPKCLSVTLTRCLRRSSIQPEAKATGIDEAKKKRKPRRLISVAEPAGNALLHGSVGDIGKELKCSDFLKHTLV